MGYGYRVYEFTAVEKPGRGIAIDLADPAEPFDDALIGMLLSLEGAGVLRGTPDYRAPSTIRGLASPIEPRAVITNVARNGRRLSCKVISGRVGDNGWTIGNTLDDISDLASGNDLRIEVLVPRFGDRGLLIAESRGRSVHVEPLVRWLTFQSAQASIAANLETWIQPQVYSIVDRTHLVHLIANAQRCEVEFEEVSIGQAGNTRARKRKVGLRGFDAMAAEDIAEEASVWAAGQRHVAGAANALAAVVGVDVGALAQADLQLERPTIRLVTANGERVTITPEQIDKVFTYPLSDHRPTIDEWEEAVRKATELGRMHGLDLR